MAQQNDFFSRFRCAYCICFLLMIPVAINILPLRLSELNGEWDLQLEKYTTTTATTGITTNGNPLWIRVSPEEIRVQSNKVQCNTHSFKHCCLGQCRQAAWRLSEDRVLWRMNRNLSQLSDVLLRFSKNTQLDRNTSCNIFFIGDSLSSDHAMGANCELLDSGYKLESCNPLLGGPAYGNDTGVQCRSNLYPHFPHFILKNKNAKSCKRVGIFFSGNVNKLFTTQPVSNEGGLIVFNWGVHCNVEGESCVVNYLKSDILSIFAGENAKLLKKWKLMYRETEPTHFDSSDGNHHPGHHNSSRCVLLEKSKRNNWRNDEVKAFLSDNNLTQRIQTIKLYNHLLPLTQLHHDGDCTHYCYNPFRFDVTWNGMFEALSPSGTA